MRSLSSELMAKIKHSYQTIGNNSQPKAKITVARAKTTVTDADYWTVETIRAKEGLGDVSVAPRRFNKHYGGPDRLYEIHVDNGQVSTALREYPDKLKQGWHPQFDLGPSSANGGSVAMAFDGEWELYRKVWRLRTHEVPWIFWVDDLGVLWGQLWNDEATKVELATGVLRVKAIRGWKELGQGQNDQGIVVAFIKTDGTLWYRSYCIQVDLTYTWESQRQITGFTGTAVSVGLFLTNDYRLGVTVQNNTGEIWWLITQRLWVGMATSPENIVSGIQNSKFEVYPIEYLDYIADEYISSGIRNSWFNVAEPIYPVPLSASNPSKSVTQIKLIFNYPIDGDLSTVASAFSIKDAVNTSFSIVATSAGINNTELVFTVQNFSSASGNMFIVYDRTIIELDCLNQGSRFAIESFTFEFDPDLAPPEGYDLENLNIGFNSQFVVTMVYYKYRYGSENVIAGIDNSKFIVTKVGSNPL